MVDNSIHPNHSSFGQGSNIWCTIPTRIPEVGGSSQPGLELAYEVTYEQVWEIRPIIHMFEKTIFLLPVAHNLPQHPKKKETTRTSVLVALVEILVLANLEELVESS